MTGDDTNPLRPICSAWIEKIRQAEEVKRKRFGVDAAEGMLFFAGPYKFLYEPRREHRHLVPPDGANFPKPSFEMTLNKAAELVQLFGPALYHRNPVRQVNPRSWPSLDLNDFTAAVLGQGQQNPQLAQQQMQQAQFLYQQATLATEKGRALDDARANILSAYLNYTPDALDLKTESRWAIDEALIKGMGCLWTEVYQPAGAPYKMVGSFFDSVDNLLIDPDATSLRDAKWVARRCTHPVWEVERKYNLPPGSLKGTRESLNNFAAVSSDPVGDYFRRIGQTNDLLTYWKVYSKMGMGARLKGQPNTNNLEAMRPTLDQFGDFCLIVVAEGTEYPLNVPPQAQSLAPEQAIPLVQWETPFWADDAWPFTPLYFHTIPGDPWPLSHLAPGMGELKFLNWIYSFVASKIAVTSRDFIAVKKALGDEIEQAIVSGKDLELIKIEHEHGTITDVIQFLQHPQFNGDIWTVAQAIGEQFDRRVGLSELMYGQSAHQFRSAEEANLKGSQMNIRPDDMANKVEDAMGAVAKCEALAARWHLQPQDVAPVLGPVGGWVWGQFLQAADVSQIVHGLEYRIEAGSAKKPNRDRDAANMQQVIQTVFPSMIQVGMASGNFDAANAILRQWGKTMDLDVDRLGIVFPSFQPPPPQPAPPGNGAPQPQGAPA